MPIDPADIRVRKSGVEILWINDRSNNDVPTGYVYGYRDARVIDSAEVDVDGLVDAPNTNDYDLVPRSRQAGVDWSLVPAGQDVEIADDASGPWSSATWFGINGSEYWVVNRGAVVETAFLRLVGAPNPSWVGEAPTYSKRASIVVERGARPVQVDVRIWVSGETVIEAAAELVPVRWTSETP